MVMDQPSMFGDEVASIHEVTMKLEEAGDMKIQQMIYDSDGDGLLYCTQVSSIRLLRMDMSRSCML